jgi:hypothetical protein
MAEKIDELYYEIRADLSKLTKDFERIKNVAKRSATSIQQDFNKVFQAGQRKRVVNFDVTLAKTRLKDLSALEKKLTAQLATKKYFNAPFGSIKATQTELRKVQSALKSIEVQTIKTESKFVAGFKRMGKAFGAYLGIYAIGRFLKSSVESYTEEDKMVVKLTANLKNNSDALVEQAHALQESTKYSDTEIITVMSLLAAFKKTEGQISELTPGIMALSSKFNVSLIQATRGVVKGLNTGTIALGRMKIELGKSKNPAEQYAIVMKYLNDNVRILKEEMGAASNKLRNTNNQLDEQQQTIGEKLAPAWLMLSTAFLFFVTTFVNGGKILRQEYDRIATGVSNLLSGQISVWEFLTKQWETAEQRLARLSKYIMPGHTPGDTATGGGAKTTPWSKAKQDRLDEINLLIKAGVSQSEYIKLKKEELGIQKELNVELEKTKKLKEFVEPVNPRIAGIVDAISRGGAETAVRGMGGGIQGTGGGGLRPGGLRQMPVKPESGLDMEQPKQDVGDMVGSMESMSNMADNIANSFDFAGKTFVQQLSQAFSIVSGIIGIISGIIGIVTGGPISLIASWAGHHLGGNFKGTPTGIKKMAAGGSFIVPAGYNHDRYPLMVESGERVSVTPKNKVGSGSDPILSQIKDAIVAQTMTLSRSGGGGGQPITIKVGNKVIAQVVQSELNKLTKSNRNLSEL